MDHNTLSDDFIGKTNIDLKPCLENPCKWAVDDFFPLKDKNNKEINSSVYVQLYWVPENANDPNIKAIDKEDKVSFANQFDILG